MLSALFLAADDLRLVGDAAHMDDVLGVKVKLLQLERPVSLL